MLVLGVSNIWIYTILIFFIGFLPLSPNEFAYLIPLSAAFSKNLWLGLGLAIICEIFILWINYSFLPKVIATNKQASPLLIITSVLSGIAIFGPLGFIIGPVLLAMVRTLYSIVIRHIKTTKRELN
jgi:predicted PurR-regulated permease PerM